MTIFWIIVSYGLASTFAGAAVGAWVESARAPKNLPPPERQPNRSIPAAIIASLGADPGGWHYFPAIRNVTTGVVTAFARLQYESDTTTFSLEYHHGAERPSRVTYPCVMHLTTDESCDIQSAWNDAVAGPVLDAAAAESNRLALRLV